MLGLFGKRNEAHAKARIANLEDRVIELMEVRNTLVDEVSDLTSENKKLSQKKQIDDEMIAHKLKMREERVTQDADKRVSDAETKAEKRVITEVGKVKDEYRTKVEKQLEKRGDEMKEIQTEILNRLPDVSLAIKQKT